MTRTYSTITWGFALILAAIVLAWQQSLPWALGAAGAVPVIAGIAKSVATEEASIKARAILDDKVSG